MQMMKKMRPKILAVASEIIHMPRSYFSNSKYIYFSFSIIRILLNIMTTVYQTLIKKYFKDNHYLRTSQSVVQSLFLSSQKSNQELVYVQVFSSLFSIVMALSVNRLQVGSSTVSKKTFKLCCGLGSMHGEQENRKQVSACVFQFQFPSPPLFFFLLIPFSLLRFFFLVSCSLILAFSDHVSESCLIVKSSCVETCEV